MSTITYSAQDMALLDQSMNTLVGTPSQNVIKTIFEILSLQLKKQTSYAKMNEVLRELNTLGGSKSPIPTLLNLLPDYTSETEVDTMFKNAFENGDSSPLLTPRDRVILRVVFIAAGIVTLTSKMLIDNVVEPSFSLTYSSNGEPENATSVFESFLDKTKRDILSLGSDIIIDLMNYEDKNDYVSVREVVKQSFDSKTNKTNATLYDISKAINIGPSYIIWIAKNKWKIDFNWNGT